MFTIHRVHPGQAIAVCGIVQVWMTLDIVARSLALFPWQRVCHVTGFGRDEAKGKIPYPTEQ